MNDTPLERRQRGAHRRLSVVPDPTTGPLVDDKQINLTWIHGSEVRAHVIDVSAEPDDQVIVTLAALAYRTLYAAYDRLEVVVEIGTAELVDVNGESWVAPLTSTERAAYRIATHCPATPDMAHGGSWRRGGTCQHCGHQRASAAPGDAPPSISSWSTHGVLDNSADGHRGTT